MLRRQPWEGRNSLVPRPYTIYFKLLWHSLACLCWKCRYTPINHPTSGSIWIAAVVTSSSPCPCSVGTRPAREGRTSVRQWRSAYSDEERQYVDVQPGMLYSAVGGSRCRCCRCRCWWRWRLVIGWWGYWQRSDNRYCKNPYCLRALYSVNFATLATSWK